MIAPSGVARWLIALPLLALVLTLAPVRSSPAQAATTDAVLVSSDGVQFASTLPAPLFARAVMIPGAVLRSTLYVKNSSDTPATLRLAMWSSTPSSSELAGSLSLRATTAQQPTGAPVSLALADSCAVLPLSQVLAPHTVAAVTLELAMADASGSRAQGSTTELGLRVSLQEMTSLGAPPADCTDGVQLPVLPFPGDDATTGASVLSFTGATLFYPAIAVGSVLLVLGASVVLLARRRRRAR